MEEGEFYAIETFGSTGKGLVRQSWIQYAYADFLLVLGFVSWVFWRDFSAFNIWVVSVL
jgi:hypothetical protein